VFPVLSFGIFSALVSSVNLQSTHFEFLPVLAFQRTTGSFTSRVHYACRHWLFCRSAHLVECFLGGGSLRGSFPFATDHFAGLPHRHLSDVPFKALYGFAGVSGAGGETSLGQRAYPSPFENLTVFRSDTSAVLLSFPGERGADLCAKDGASPTSVVSSAPCRPLTLDGLTLPTPNFVLFFRSKTGATDASSPPPSCEEALGCCPGA